MDLPVDKYIDGLLSNTSAETPSDSKKVEQLEMELPPWYDERLFNKGRKFFWYYCFSLSSSMFIGLVAVLSVPSILKVLVGSHRSSSSYTAFKRYLSTLLHTMSWFKYPLKPGSVSWRSLYAVRSRHVKAGLAAKAFGIGTVSQRDLALTQFGFMGFCFLRPDKFGIIAQNPDDWEAYNHFWRTIGYMIGIEDRYNLCRKTIEETREVCKIVLDRVYTPCLENVPEYFEHMSFVLIDGMWSVNPTTNPASVIYTTKYLANVPGYVYTEQERIAFQKTLKEKLKGKSLDTGVASSELMNEPSITGAPEKPPRLHYYHDYDVLHKVPTYKKLSWFEKYKLNSANLFLSLYSTYLGRLYFNLNYLYSLLLMQYLPYLAFYRFGIKSSYVNIFVESPSDDTTPLRNSEFSKEKPVPWYWSWLSWFW